MAEGQKRRVVIIGAGPAGLTAAYELLKYNVRPIVLEQNDKVGGIARTENFKGYYFDMGGHRFFTKAEVVNRLWHEVLGDDFLLRPRLSRIYYQNKFYYYPLKILNALTGLGIWQAVLILLSFIKWQIFPYKQEVTFEEWVTNRFGKRLFEIFFKTYTEKVWGIPCTELKAEWAAQRIKDLSLKTALLSMLVKPKNSIKTLTEEFHYPRLGPGMLWNQIKNEIERQDGVIYLNSPVVKIKRTGKCIDHVVISRNGYGEEIVYGTDFISSMPVSEFVKRLDPAPAEVLHAANQLNYRDFLTVCLIVDKADLFPDNWIYVHSPEVKVGRIQNFKNWSADMVPDPSKTSLGLEYFCNEGDSLWTMPDEDLIELGKREIERIGMAKAGDVIDGIVFRVPKAYPIYDSAYKDYLEKIKEFVDSLENFQTIGRNGLHRYNNQDHSMITAMLAVRNLIYSEKNDLWSVNSDPEYHEEIKPEKTKEEEKLKETFTRIFPRIDPLAFGFSAGTIAGVLLFVSTIFLTILNGHSGDFSLQLLENYLPGYHVSFKGSIIGMLYLFFGGFVIGTGSAYMRNLMVYIGARIIHRDIELYLLRRMFDFF
ncbi:MAG: NAD(P)/FAD-dependent oxidoreductase [Candidatus Methanosuratincola sp.]